MYKKPNEFLYDHVSVNTLILSLSNVSSSSPELVYGCLIYVVLCFIRFPNNAMDGEISLAGSVDIAFYTIVVIYLELYVICLPYFEQFNLSKTSNMSTTRMNKFLIGFLEFLNSWWNTHSKLSYPFQGTYNKEYHQHPYPYK